MPRRGAGFFFGRTPLIKLSPKKTWEGFLGGLVLTVLCSWLLADIMSRWSWMTCPRTVRKPCQTLASAFSLPPMRAAARLAAGEACVVLILGVTARAGCHPTAERKFRLVPMQSSSAVCSQGVWRVSGCAMPAGLSSIELCGFRRFHLGVLLI